MPLFLTPQLEQQWLSAKDEEALIPIFNYEISDQERDYYPVFTLRGYPNRRDGNHCYEPYQWSDLPPLGQNGPMQQSLF
ncbi:hypothetical protein ABE426_01415 [Sphingobacterium faecium]|uniref:hypothetical protein n=1 Tax=Sphingobacterium faecium TaxID=34087 RepID=UPI003207EB2B